MGEWEGKLVSIDREHNHFWGGGRKVIKIGKSKDDMHQVIKDVTGVVLKNEVEMSIGCKEYFEELLNSGMIGRSRRTAWE